MIEGDGYMRLAFYLGMTFIWLPLFFLIPEFRAASEQSAIHYPQFGIVNNIAVTVVELAGITMVLGVLSREHLAISSIAVISSICGLFMTLGLLIQVTAKLGLFR
jgi:hypothetical protein